MAAAAAMSFVVHNPGDTNLEVSADIYRVRWTKYRHLPLEHVAIIHQLESDVMERHTDGGCLEGYVGARLFFSVANRAGSVSTEIP